MAQEVAHGYLAISASMQGVGDDIRGELSGIGDEIGEEISKGVSLSSGLKDAGADIQALGGSMTDAGKTTTKYVTGPLAAATLGLMGLATQHGNYADGILDLADKTGTGTAALQELHFWADMNGVSTGNVDRAMRRLNQRVGMAADGNEKYAGALQRLGVDMQAVEDGTLSTDEAFRQAVAGLGEIESESERAAAAADLFGTSLGGELMPLINSGADDMDAMAEKANELGIVMDQDALEAADGYRREMVEVQAAMRGLWTELATTLIPVIRQDLVPILREDVVPLLESFFEWVGNLASSFAALDPEVRKAILAGAGIAAALGPVLIIAGKVVTAIGAIVSGVGSLIGVLTGASTGLGRFGQLLRVATGPIGLLVGGLVAAFISSEDFRLAVFGLLEVVGSLVATIFESFMPVFEALIPLIELVSGIIAVFTETVLAPLLTYFAEHLTQAIQALLPLVETTFETIAEVIETVVSLVEGIITTALGIITGDWEKAWSGVEQVASSVWGAIESLISGALSVIGGLITGALSEILGIFDLDWNTALSIVSGIWDSISGAVSGAVSSVGSFISTGFNTAVSTISGAVGSMYSAVTGAFSDILSAVASLPGEILSSLGNMGSLLMDSGRALIRGFTDGIRNAFGGARNAVTTGLSTLRNLLPFSPAKEGPFSGRGYTTYSGRALINDLGEGIKDATPSAVSAMRGTAEDLADSMLAESPVPDFLPDDWTATSIDAAQVPRMQAREMALSGTQTGPGSSGPGEFTGRLYLESGALLGEVKGALKNPQVARTASESIQTNVVNRDRKG